MSDRKYDPIARRTLFVLQNARHDFEKSKTDAHGAHIASILYQAKDVRRAWDDALWAGMKPLIEPHVDALTGLKTAYLSEPCGGNVIMLTEHYAPAAELANVA